MYECWNESNLTKNCSYYAGLVIFLNIGNIKIIWNRLPLHVGKFLSMSWDHLPMEIEFGLGMHWIRGCVNLKPGWQSNLHSWPTLISLLKQSGELINVLINLLARLMVGHLLTIAIGDINLNSIISKYPFIQSFSINYINIPFGNLIL